VNDIIDDEWSNIRIFNVSQPGVVPKYPQEYNRLVTSPEFWANFQSRFVLITQPDVAIFRRLDDWMFDYSFIGAPWPEEEKKYGFFGAPWPEEQKKDGKPRVGNGGYSLRHVDTKKTVLQTNNYAAEHPDAKVNEDLWWHDKIPNLPSEEKAGEFSVENPFNGREVEVPTGAHQQWKKPLMKKLGKAFRLIQQYGRCI
jgi:hypothetical protein